MKPSCICTFSTSASVSDLRLFLKSIRITNSDIPLVMFLDTTTNDAIKDIDLSHMKVDITVNLDLYSHKDKDKMVEEGIWSDFQMTKASIIEYCLTKYADALFLDADIFLVNPIHIPEDAHEYDIGLSPHYTNDKNNNMHGYYNGGVVWARDRQFGKKWREYTKTSRYHDQASLENCAERFRTFRFGENYNVAWWRLTLALESHYDMLRYYTADESNVYYKGLPIMFVHTHFYKKDLDYFNKAVYTLLTWSKSKTNLVEILNPVMKDRA